MNINLELNNWGLAFSSDWLWLEIKWILLLIAGLSVVAYKLIKKNKKGKK